MNKIKSTNIYKALFILLLTFTFNSCSSDDNNDSDTNNEITNILTIDGEDYFYKNFYISEDTGNGTNSNYTRIFIADGGIFNINSNGVLDEIGNGKVIELYFYVDQNVENGEINEGTYTLSTSNNNGNLTVNCLDFNGGTVSGMLNNNLENGTIILTQNGNKLKVDIDLFDTSGQNIKGIIEGDFFIATN